MAFPGSIDSFTSPQGTSLLTSPDHANLHATSGSAIINIETFIGTSAASNGLFNSYLSGQTPLPIKSGTMGTVVSSGTINNSVIGTPAITGGTANNQTLGTPRITLGGDTTGDLYYRSTGGTATRLAAGSSGYFLQSGGTGAAPQWASSMGSINQVLGTNLVTAPAYTYTSNAYGTIAPGTFLLTPTLASGKALIMLNCGISNSSGTSRVGVEIIAYGTAYSAIYTRPVGPDANNPTNSYSVQIFLTGLPTTVGTIQAGVISPDGGTAYIWVPSLTLIEFA